MLVNIKLINTSSATLVALNGISFQLHASSNDYFDVNSICTALGGVSSPYYTSANWGYKGSNVFNTYPKSKNSKLNWFYLDYIKHRFLKRNKGFHL